MFISAQTAAARLADANEILIITHIRPDGDTAGSACALCLGLRALGKTAYLAHNPPSMHRYDTLMLPYSAPADFSPRFVAAVDIASPAQYPPGWEDWADRTDLAVDHHGTNSGYARETCLEADSAAAGEIIYEILCTLGVSITADIGRALYTALATDTGGFRTAGTTSRTLSIASALYDTGFDVFALTHSLFETRSRARLALEAYLFGNMRFPRPEICLMRLPYRIITDCGAVEDDMDKLSTLTTVPEGASIGILIRELADGTWKCSLRTDGSIHAGNILKPLGPGGGHADAAGTVLSGAPADIEQAILDGVKAALLQCSQKP